MNHIVINEVGPRDGLQNEKAQVSTADKLTLIQKLAGAGLVEIEATAFVSPRWVPQMADATEVLSGADVPRNCRLTALTPNLKGYGRAKAAGVGRVAVFIAASETFSQKNTACSIDESLERVRLVMEAARADDMPVRGYISCITHCPYEGVTDPEVTERLAAFLVDQGVTDVSLGETLGRAQADETDRLLQQVTRSVDTSQLAGHFHDTEGRALESVSVALGYGLRIFDSAAGGLGGCPYAPGAAGNVATGVLVDHLAAQGYTTGLDRKKLAEAEMFARGLRG